jgi:hypothetical protein
MRLKILALSHQTSGYRGTDRSSPHYYDAVEQSHPVNQAFLNYVDFQDKLLTSSDLVQTANLVQLYEQLDPPQHFEIVEVTKEDEKPQTQSDLLGYDLSGYFHYSLLAYGFKLCAQTTVVLPPDDIYWTIVPLVCLIEHHFKPRLNANSLFSEYAGARFCLDCMMALQKIRPELFESPTYQFDVVGVWKVHL